MEQLRIAGADTRSVEEVLTDDVPVDGLQHAGSAILRAERSEVLDAIARRLIEALGERGWTGDAELTAELERCAHVSASDLNALPVALDELGEALVASRPNTGDNMSNCSEPVPDADDGRSRRHSDEMYVLDSIDRQSRSAPSG